MPCPFSVGAIAGSLGLAGCNTDIYQLPTRAMKELSPEMLALLGQKGMPGELPILVRIFKEESELEVWKQDTTGRFECSRCIRSAAGRVSSGRR